MNPVMIWAAELKVALMKANDKGTVSDFKEQYNPSFKGTGLEVDLSGELLNVFKYANGFEISWHAGSEKRGGGRSRYLTVENVLQNWEGILYQDEHTAEDERIRFFKAIDLITSEAQCGFLLFPSGAHKEIYYNETGRNQLYGLDVDISGYLDMALASRVYNYWPKVLLDIQSGEESTETVNFKQNMPLIFSEFNWEEFKEKYQSLRLSAK